MDKDSNNIENIKESLNTIPEMTFTSLINEKKEINKEKEKKYKTIDGLYTKNFIENYINNI